MRLGFAAARTTTSGTSLCYEPPKPFRSGDYAALRRPCPAAALPRRATPLKASHSVYIEAECETKDPVASPTAPTG